MIKFSLVLKWVIVILFGLGGATAMAYYYANPSYSDSIWQYPQSIYEYFLKKPKAPEIVDQKKEGGCGTRVWWVDNALDEDGVRFDRRIVGQPNFVTVQITGPHAGIPGSFDESNLPMGTYEYRVGVFNEYGTSYSNTSDQIVLPAVCGNAPLPIKPLNPVITSLERVKDQACTVRVYFNDNATDEDGIRIYRSDWNDPDVLLADLPPNNGPTGIYDDTNIPPGHYTYQVSAYNANGEAFSQLSDEIEITEEECGQANLNAEIALLVTPNIAASTTATPTPGPKACIWKAALNVFVRTGPGASLYPEITALEKGTEEPVVGQSEDKQFLALEIEPGLIGYVPKEPKYGETTGDCDVPILKDPEAAPPSSPGEPAAGPPQCNDGVDNDGDGVIDMRDRGCTSPDDNSE